MFPHLTVQNKRSVFSSGLILFAANLLPIIAVWKLNWTFYDLLVLYWAEIIFVGMINILRMVLINPRETTLGFHLLKIAYVPFFAGHFGLFCVGIGLGLQVVFGKDNFEAENQIVQMIFGDTRMLFWPLGIAHIFSFFWNYVAQREYRRTTILRRMVAPYIRIIPNLAFVAGMSYAGLRYPNPLQAMIALILGKVVIDLVMHVFLHYSMMNQAEERPMITVRD